MSGALQGEAVHRHHGKVQVIEQRNHGIELRILSNSGQLQWVRRHELLRAPARTRLTLPAMHHATTLSPVERESRTIIEALRYGINPARHIEQFTFGRDQEIAAISQWLATNSGDATRILIGAYGQGKSHFLNYLYELALQQGYAVALVEVDQEKAPFGKPKRLYQQVMRSLRYIDRETGERDDAKALITKILDRGLADYHPYFSDLRTQREDWRWAWILAENAAARPYGLPVPSLPDFSTAGNLYSYLLTSLAYLCSQSPIGLRGLLLLFDECEALSVRPTAQQTAHVGRKGLEIAISLIKAAEYHPRQSGRQSIDSRSYGSYRDVPELYPPMFVSGQHPLKLVFAFPEHPRELWSFPQRDHQILELAQLSDDQVLAIFTGAVRHYNRAYSYSTPIERFRAMFELVAEDFAGLPSLRLKIKFLIEALDLLRHHPEASPQELFGE